MLDVVCLSSGGLDSTVCLKLFQASGLDALPVFINYGQRNLEFELGSLQENCRDHQFRNPTIIDLKGFGESIRTGLTSETKDVYCDAFTPNRNLLFLTIAGSIAYDRGCSKLALGFLNANNAIFPDQTDAFLQSVEQTLSASLGTDISIHAPLRDMSKQEVLKLAKSLGIVRYYSCHSGGEPCGHCIACLEYTEV
jgi:7-cyano-7-deazaguanine synthase